MSRFLILLTIWPGVLLAQLNESFTDGEILNNPAWFGHVDSFMVNTDLELQLSANNAGTSFIYTRSEAVENASWIFSVAYKFSPSTSNYARVYLAMDSNAPGEFKNAVYCDIGRNSDRLELGIIDSGEEKVVIRGEDGLLSAGENELTIRVTRNDNSWLMQFDMGEGMQTVGQMECEINFPSEAFGIFCEYTKTRTDKFFFDDISVEGSPFQDRYPPELVDFRVVNGECLKLVFNEELDADKMQLSDFYLTKLDCYPTIIEYDNDKQELQLFFNPGLNNVRDETLQIKNITDLSGNIATEIDQQFDYKRVEVVKAQLRSDSQLFVGFSRAVPQKSWEQAILLIDGNVWDFNVDDAQVDNYHYLLTTGTPFEEGRRYQLFLSGIKDDRGDTIRAFQKEIWYYPVKRFDVVINEMMPDPDPIVGLPGSEYIELYNRTGFGFSLEGWSFDVNTRNVELPDTIIGAGEYLLLVPSSQEFLWPGNVAGLDHWPALTNSGCSIVLYDHSGDVIDALRYVPDGIAGEKFKAEGGWSAERIDVDNMSGINDNWQWSMSLDGGTPGKVNSVAASNSDEFAPYVVYLEMPEDTLVRLHFNEAMNFKGQEWNLEISPVIENYSVSVDSVFLSYLSIHLDEKLPENNIYTLSFNDLSDWAGNDLIQDNPLRFAKTDTLEVNDIVINEVLFNPRPDGLDFIELYNSSRKVLAVNELCLAKWDDERLIEELIPLTGKRRLIFPGDYLVLSEDSLIIQEQYNCINPQYFLNVKDMPSMPDDEGYVVIANRAGDLIDYFEYTDKMHFDLIKDTEGVSLERLLVTVSAQDGHNWHSAASSVGYATPGYQNSQTINEEETLKTIGLDNDVFTPNGDGVDDQLIIRYKNEETGVTINIRVYDSSGREVRYLVNNQLMAGEGFYSWDGLDEDGQALVPGIYIVWIQRCYSSGKVEKDKLVCVAGR